MSTPIIPLKESAAQAPTTQEESAQVTTLQDTLALLVPAGSVFEVRALDVPRAGTVSGYFTDHTAAAQAGAQLDGRASAIYLTLNAVTPDAMSRAANRLKSYAKHTTADTEIVRRRWLLLDIDPHRPAGISSTDEEHAAALDRCYRVRERLLCEGWPEPILADSGNGGHLLYPIDLPNDDASRSLIQRLLVALARRFDDPADANPRVTLDVTVYNAARITKLYGTRVRKGDSTPERPHRRSQILSAPTALQPATIVEEGRAS